jgi:hypothetical protein
MNAVFMRLLGVRNGGIHAVNPAEDNFAVGAHRARRRIA